MYALLLLLLLPRVIHAAEQNSGSYEVREHTLTRPYSNGMLKSNVARCEAENDALSGCTF